MRFPARRLSLSYWVMPASPPAALYLGIRYLYGCRRVGGLGVPGAVYTDMLAFFRRGLDEKSTANDPVYFGSAGLRSWCVN